MCAVTMQQSFQCKSLEVWQVHMIKSWLEHVAAQLYNHTGFKLIQTRTGLHNGHLHTHVCNMCKNKMHYSTAIYDSHMSAGVSAGEPSLRRWVGAQCHRMAELIELVLERPERAGVECMRGRGWERDGRELKGVRGIIQPKDGVLPGTQGGMRGQQCSSTASISHPCDPLHNLLQSLHCKILVFHVCTNLNIMLRKCITNLTVISPSGLQVYCVEAHNCHSPVACVLKQVSSRLISCLQGERTCVLYNVHAKEDQNVSYISPTNLASANRRPQPLTLVAGNDASCSFLLQLACAYMKYSWQLPSSNNEYACVCAKATAKTFCFCALQAICHCDKTAPV